VEFAQCSLTYVRFCLDLDSHRLVKSDDLYDRHERSMVPASLLQVANNRLSDIVDRHRDVYARFVNLVPAFSTSLLNRMFNVLESLVNLQGEIFRILFGSTIPSTCLCQYETNLSAVNEP
jgi:hypothetical protein